jgi:hypothetical protein
MKTQMYTHIHMYIPIYNVDKLNSYKQIFILQVH